ncbi:K02A2.6-like [Cordylochernes scorpioides]|uniref:K02A2.6-like n=1 Tax=Cordylochernes scorpioides TaxID=51811 RepID=A0ABY6KH80_9ARAC|nr:K02A2.6-like [Cordylochernes scorpioides]
MFLALAVEYNLILHQMDVQSAYLNGEIKEEIYMTQPENFVSRKYPERVCRLKKAIYGLKQAGIVWHERLDNELKNLGLKQLQSDNCVYIKHDEGILLVAIYVDDLIIAAEREDTLKSFKESMKRIFKIKDLGGINCCLGIRIQMKEDGSISIDQERYIEELLAKYRMKEAKPISTPMDSNSKLTKISSIEGENEPVKKVEYQSLIGSLIYLSVSTRPDIAYAVSALGKFSNDPRRQHWNADKRVLRYLKGTSCLRITYRKSNEALHGYVDADWGGNLVDRKSHTGIVYFLARGPIAWESKKQQTVTLSSTESEYVALCEAGKEAVYLRALLDEMGFGELLNGPTVLKTDNQGAQQLARNPVYHARTKHIDIKWHYIRSICSDGLVEVVHTPTQENVADILTKGLPRTVSSNSNKRLIRTSSKFVPRIPTEEQKEVRMEVCQNMIEMTQIDPEWGKKKSSPGMRHGCISMTWKPNINPANELKEGTEAQKSDWPKWIRRFERFRQASGLINNPENEQVNMLVYCMGDNADDILLSCKIASDQLENYNKVIECFESHFIPRRNIIYERARFNQRCQQEGEKVNEFITALHSLAEHCNFGMLHDELIRDRIVVGVRDRALSERMQLDTDLTLVKATLMAKQLESVKEQQSSLYQQDSVDQIKKMPNHIKETKRHEPKIRQFKSNQLGGSSHGCTRCGNSNNHDWKNCPAMNSYCSKCKKKGHYAKVCRSEAINEIKSEIAFLGSVEDNSKKWIVPIKVNNRQINFKIDTGADVNVLPLQYYYQSFQRIKLEKSDKILQGPNGIPLETVGMIHVKLQNKGQHLNSKIYIVDKLKQPLLSGETSEKLNIVRMIQQLSSNFLNPKREFPEIFNGLGHAKINYKISLQPDAKPYALCTPRRVPIPLMKQVKEQLEEMTRLGVIESVEEPTEWCAGMVAVSKPGGKIRICVDLTKLNQYIRRENYPLPATEHILGQLGNACYFSKLDANSGFWQFGLAKESQKLTTFITPFGRFFFKRIPFGITSAPEIFQRKMTQLLGKIEGVVCFMDDIVVYGSSLEEHNERVRQVLKKIQEEGMTLNPEKCQFGVKTVKFLGHTLSSEGLFIDEEKLDAITKMEAPRSTKELKSFLGMVNYLGKFIPNLADKLQPLNSLLSTKNEWVWDEPQKKSFNLLKQELVSRPNLALFDPSRTTIVSADASSFGLGGVLRQEQSDGSLKPIAYVSRTLSETEKRYSQIEKEGLAIVWTCDRLKDYVTGIKIHIETDHKPLIAIFTSKSLEDMTPRLQRLKMRMMRYSYQISHIAGKKQIVADMLSRKPMSKPHKDELEEELSAYIQSIEFPATEKKDF